MRPLTLFLAAVLAAVFSPTADLRAQDITAQTVGEAEVALGDLELALVPLTKAELEAEAAAWQQVLKAKAIEVSQAQIVEAGLEDEARAAQAEEVGLLREQRVAIEDRFTTVLEALRTKGGEVEEYETYLAAVATFGVQVDLTEPSAAWTAITGWLTSAEGGVRWGRNILLFLATIIVFKILAGILGRVTDRAVRTFRQTPELLRSFFVNVVRKTTLLVGFIVAISMLGVNIAPLLAAMGGVAFVVGFALQGTLSNFACGIMILLYRPYDIGDYVNVAGVAGTVKAMSLVSTSLSTPDNQTVVVPNGSIWGGIITNVTANETRRVDLVIGIGYSDDIARAQQALESVVTNHPLVLSDPAPAIMVHELADSSVNFVVRPWTKTSDYWGVKCELTRMIKERFDQEGISIPFPQQDVHMHQAASA